MTLAASFRQSAVSKYAFYPALAFIIVAGLVAAPILLNLYLPLVDIPNHIARHYLATSNVEALDQYYEYTFRLVPNSTVDLIWILGGGRGDPVRFSQIAMALSAIGLVAMTMVLSRVVWGAWSVWPAAVGLLAYHASFFWGFQNYVAALPFVLVGMALWLAAEPRPIWLRILIFTPFVFALFIMHFFAFLGLAVMVFGREMQRIVEAGRDWKTQTKHAAALAVPFLVALGYLFAQITFSEPSPSGSMTTWGHWLHRLEAVYSLTLGGRYELPRGLTISGLAALFLCLAFLAFGLKSTGPRLALRREMRGPIIMLCVLVLASPVWLNGVAYVHLRFPVLLAAALFASTRWKGLNTRMSASLAGIVLALICVRAVQFDRYASEHDREVRTFIEIVETLPAGSRLLPIRASDRVGDERLWHIAGYAVIGADVFVPTLFQGVHGLNVLPRWRDYSHPAKYAASTTWLSDAPEGNDLRPQFVFDWPKKFTHAIMIDRANDLLDPFEELVEIASADRFTLYEIVSK